MDIWQVMINYNMAKGWTTMTIRDSTLEALSEYHKSKNIEKKVSPWIDEILSSYIPKAEFLTKKFASQLEMIAIKGNYALLEDTKVEDPVKVIKEKDSLYCKLDKTDNCIHTQYVAAMPELAQIFKNESP